MRLRVLWDDWSDYQDHGWVYYEASTQSWQAVPGRIGRDPDATADDLAFALDVDEVEFEVCYAL